MEKELKIGEVTEIMGVRVKVMRFKQGCCEKCAFLKIEDCLDRVPCCGVDNSLGLSVYFKKL